MSTKQDKRECDQQSIAYLCNSTKLLVTVMGKLGGGFKGPKATPFPSHFMAMVDRVIQM